MKTLASPIGLVIQPDALLVPRRPTLSRLSQDELVSLLVAIDEQLSVGAGNPCPTWNRKE